MTLRLNIGCGYNKLDGYVNVDSFPGCEPDLLCDLERTPWPFEDDSVMEIHAHHVLEHLGESREQFFSIIKEMYRICRHDGHLVAIVPHPLHVNYISDPTHVRPYTSLTFQMLSRQICLDWVSRRVNVTPIALMLDVAFEIERIEHIYDWRWRDQLKAGRISLGELRERAVGEFGVVREIRARLRIDKSHLREAGGLGV